MNAEFLLNVIDWANANPYELYMILKKQYSSIENLIKLFPYSLTLISNGNLKTIPQKSDWVIDFYNNGTYVDFYLDMNVLIDKAIPADYSDILNDSIKKEIHCLFSRA